MKKQSLATAYAMQRRAKGKKMSYGGVTGGQAPGETKARGISSQDNEDDFPARPESSHITANEYARHACRGESCQGCASADCYAYGGMARADGNPNMNPGYGSQAGEGRLSTNREVPMTEGEAQRMAKQALEDSAGYQGIADRIRKQRMFAKGGKVDGGDYQFDIHDEIEHPNYYDTRDEQIADEQLYEDTYGPDPMGSNEKGRKLADEDEHGRKLFHKIKMKKAQPGDRGNY